MGGRDRLLANCIEDLIPPPPLGFLHLISRFCVRNARAVLGGNCIEDLIPHLLKPTPRAVTVPHPVTERAKRTKVMERVRATIAALDDVIRNEPFATPPARSRAVRRGALIAVTLQTPLPQPPPLRRVVVGLLHLWTFWRRLPSWRSVEGRLVRHHAFLIGLSSP